MKLGQNTLIQGKIFEQSVKIMGYTIEDMVVEIELKDDKIELPDFKVFEEMKKLGLKRTSIKKT